MLLPRMEVPSNSPVLGSRITENTLQATLWAGVAISLVFVAVRLWIRIRVFRRLQLDDPFVIAAWLLSVANAAIWTAISREIYFDSDLANSRLEQIPPDFIQRLERLIRGNLSAYLLAYASLWSIKISFIVFFRNFGEKLRNQRIAWYAVLGFCLASFAVCIGTVDYRCLTSKGMKMISVCREPRTTTFEFVTLRLTTALDVLTDFSIILLSTNVLWRIRLRLWTKLALAGIFSLTLFVIAIAIVRIANASSSGKLDLSWLVCWQGIELSAALIIVCIASFRILYTSTQHSNRDVALQKYYKNLDDSKISRSKVTRVDRSEPSYTSRVSLEQA
ncbi:uncharacterized protein BDR25DRAFT_272125 [Lindgomyces ingoldianus]|uniref:Uncharacterized protein n=1 Tax=Lindgomyces ingoldianus TaxID=673940 RepID=A0ACB6QB24_9PLEO|nr:uncharacterized protein BDR25DRAFT_272125 [Lindgomyces ingoldianus]KAF2464158.1 hypothetical protein BDR25DRAFT_272125 [Lindgomyces ingoldianus]